MKDTNSILMKFISTQGYKNTSPDVNNPVNVIPSNRITMKDVDFPVKGVDNLGNEQVMMPGGEYLFGGDYVIETPMKASGGEMMRRADGSYSKRGLWDNIRANAGSGKKPTKEMLEQEKKLNSKKMGGCMECGGQMQEGGEQPVEQAPNITDALGEISMMIENGTDPNEIMTMLVEQGISEDEASSIINSAMTEIEEDDIEEEDADLDEEDIEPDSPVDEEDSSEDDALFFEDDTEEMKYGGIKINSAKKGTFKAQATRMGMSVQEAAEHILQNKEEFSPAMVKKANFAKNFAKELGGHMYEMAAGGTVPERYKNMGFTKVGVKKQSTRPGKKWMVLAKKGDKYKVVHGGWKGMQDFKQHRSEERKERFWDRMGGKDSAKAKDPFSPLYWHKKFGTWAEGGEPQNAGFQALPDAVKAKILENMKYDNGGESMYNYADYVSGDVRTNKTEKGTINSLENNAVNRGLAMANTLGDPRMMMWSLPNKGILGTIKGIAGAAAGLSGAALGYSKLFSDGKSTDYITNAETKESGKMEDVLAKRRAKAPVTTTPQNIPSGPISGGSGMGSMYLDDLKNEKMMAEMGIDPINEYKWAGVVKYQDGGTFKDWFVKNSTRVDVMQNVGDQAKLEEMWKAETAQQQQPQVVQQQPVVANTAGPTAEVATSVGNTEVAQTPGGSNPPGQTSPTANKFSYTNRGDSIGIVAANNALAGLGMVNQVLDAKDYQKEYEQRMREIGNTMSRYNPQNAVNPFGNYTLNAGPASNFGLVANTPIQDFGTKMSSAKFGGLIPFIPATRSYQEGGEYYADEDEIKRILAMGGEIEFID